MEIGFIGLIDSSTVDPATVQAIAAAAGRQRNPFADAPVSGAPAARRPARSLSWLAPTCNCSSAFNRCC